MLIIHLFTGSTRKLFQEVLGPVVRPGRTGCRVRGQCSPGRFFHVESVDIELRAFVASYSSGGGLPLNSSPLPSTSSWEDELNTEDSPGPLSPRPPSSVTQALWREILGPSADPSRSFLDNGGDSFHAVLFSTRLYETIGAEVDYLDVLTSDDLSALVALTDDRTAA